jgi:hypothetical protein
LITPTDWTRFKFEWLEQVMYAADLTPAAKVVAFCIIQHCNIGSESGWPSLKRIAALTKLRKATVIDAVALLVKQEHLEKTPGTAGYPGRGQSNVYTPIQKGAAVAPLKDTERVRLPDPSVAVTRDVTFQERVRSSEEKGTVNGQKGTLKRRKGTVSGPEHLKEHLQGTPSLNTERACALPRDEEIQKANKKVEKDLSDWLSAGLVDEREAVEIRTVVGELLDGYAVGEATREDVEVRLGQVEAPDEAAAIEKGAAEFGVPVKRLMALRR